ncbi:MAG: response regulator [Deltaproteobacteria bacterium]|nr:response regulator [Deltaproteobacteria bacterium]
MEANHRVPIFLVEDDSKLTVLIKEYLERHNFTVATEDDGNRAVERILNEKPAMVILDILLPGKDGRTICRELRPRYDGPIMMLTALDEEVDQVLGLEMGADDYLTKPVQPRLLLSRINAILRFAARSGGYVLRKDKTGIPLNHAEKIALGRLEIHIPSRTVFMNGKSIDLTTTQFNLLSYLAVNAGQIISRDQLYQHLQGIDYDGLNRSIDLSIVRLREKIGDNGKHPCIIKSIRGQGYLMVKPL